MSKVLGLASVSMLVLILSRIDNPDVAYLEGRVTDEKLVAIADASVSASNVFSAEVERVKSDARGLYKFTGLRQGRYSVFAEAEGYCSKWVFNVLLVRGQNASLARSDTNEFPQESAEGRLHGGVRRAE